METVLPLMAGLSVVLFVLGAFRANHPAYARRRIEGLVEPERANPLSASFSARVLAPLVTRGIDVVTGLLPNRILAAVRRHLEMAGEPIPMQRLLTIWVALGVVLPILTTLLLVIVRAGIGGPQLLALALWVVVGNYLPWVWLRRRARGRGRQIGRDLPDAIDLIITNIEAGLGMQAALLTVAEKMSGPVAEEFGRVVRAISLGRSRSDAFNNMAERSGVADMRLFARAVAQAEQTGTPIAKVLRHHAQESRLRRRQHAREQAAKIPVKITLPTVLFMFPTIFLLVLGPVVLYAMDLLGGSR